MGGRAGIRIAGGIGGAHAEAVVALTEAGVSDGIGAVGIGAAVQGALEGGAHLIGRDAEIDIGGRGRAARCTVDTGFGRRGIDEPLVWTGGCGIYIASGIDSAHLEVVAALGQAGIGLRADAGGVGTAVQGAFEGGPRLTRREIEGGAGLVGRAGGATAKSGIGWCHVDAPGETGW